MQTTYLTTLHGLLATRFSEDELRQLCFQLGVDYEDLPPGGKSSKARELVLHQDRRKQLAELKAAVNSLRPDVNWPEEPVPSSDAASDRSTVGVQVTLHIQLDAEDFDRLVGILAALPEFRSETSRIDFMDDAFAGSPRRTDILGLLDLGGTPRSAAVRVVTRLTQFGQDTEGREALAVLVDSLLTYLGEGSHAAFLRGLFNRYPLQVSRDSVTPESVREALPARTDIEPELVHLDDSTMFAISTRAVLAEEYAAFLRANPGHPRLPARLGWSGQEPMLDALGKPVVGVRYLDAEAYCLWLTEVTGRAYRLPSEAEWRAAVQSGKTTVEPGLAEWTSTPEENEAARSRLGKPPERMILCKLSEPEREAGDPVKRFGYPTGLAGPTFTFRIMYDTR